MAKTSFIKNSEARSQESEKNLLLTAEAQRTQRKPTFILKKS
jgi:hypothetical protein